MSPAAILVLDVSIGNKEMLLINDALNTFHLRHMASDIIKNQSDSERGNLLPPHGLLFLLYAQSHRHDSTYHGLCYTSQGALAGTGSSEYKSKFEICTGLKTICCNKIK